ncbi:hypothetical protein E3T55_07065 [Cryobacterium frigoriphilum]|uniref:Uncharacterized protein n=1 Tax=Cryobacterium frigoriphilum TaxID=1259150 RepID=A0A4R9A4P4_9MICO|nr:hypothetical protein [Cryobacterium frigoriphilum]TFD52138.1 hypothetical protein E3T55_07065 [Cryobacterium frigoriphilum]
MAPLPVPAPAVGGSGLEVLPLVEQEVGLPASAELPDLLENTAPADATATGRLVAGLPAVIRPVPDSVVTSSAVKVTGSTVIVSLAAETSVVVAEVLAHYVKAFGAVGLGGTPAAASDGTTVQTFYRGGDSVTVTVGVATAGATPYTLRGFFSTGN